MHLKVIPQTLLLLGVLAVNLYFGQKTEFALINTGILGLGLYLTRVNLVYAAGLSLMPLLYWSPGNYYSGLMVLMTMLGLVVLSKLSKWRLLFFLGFIVPVILAAQLTINGVVHIQPGQKPSFDREKLFMYQSDAKSAIILTTRTYQTDLWRQGVPFTDSGRIHNFFLSSVFLAIRNTADLLTISNFYLTILFANMYLVTLGLITQFKEKDESALLETFFLSFIYFISIGILLFAGRNACFYPLVPWLIYLAGKGARNANPVVYSVLILSQLLILGWK